MFKVGEDGKPSSSLSLSTVPISLFLFLLFLLFSEKEGGFICEYRLSSFVSPNKLPWPRAIIIIIIRSNKINDMY